MGSRNAVAKGALNELTSLSDIIDRVHNEAGAPGDWGYDTPLGKALFWLYSLGPDVNRHRAALAALVEPSSGEVA